MGTLVSADTGAPQMQGYLAFCGRRGHNSKKSRRSVNLCSWVLSSQSKEGTGLSETWASSWSCETAASQAGTASCGSRVAWSDTGFVGQAKFGP